MQGEECMVAYKKVVISCAYFGVSGTVEEYLDGYERALFKSTHRTLLLPLCSLFSPFSLSIFLFLFLLSNPVPLIFPLSSLLLTLFPVVFNLSPILMFEE